MARSGFVGRSGESLLVKDWERLGGTKKAELVQANVSSAGVLEGFGARISDAEMNLARIEGGHEVISALVRHL